MESRNIPTSTAQTRIFALCADDYGYRPGVSAAICRLAEQGRLSATSALVTFPDWQRARREIGALSKRIDVGLHFNLVEGAPLGRLPRLAPSGRFPTIGELSKMAVFGRIEADEVRDEAMRQIEAFERACGRLPDFIDGHQHAHGLPGIAAVIAELAGRLGKNRPILLRDPSERAHRIVRRRVSAPKALAIAALTRRLKVHARKSNLSMNEGFSGVYDFSPQVDLHAVFRSFLTHAGRRPLIMCHPGDEEPAPSFPDPISPARAKEAEFFASDAFGALLSQRGVRLARFTEMVAMTQTQSRANPAQAPVR